VFPPGSTTAARYPGLELVHESDEGRIYRNPNALPRAWFVYRVAIIPDDDAQLDYMARPDFDPATIVVVPTPVPTTGPPPAVPDPTPTVTYTPNTVTVAAAPSAPAILVLADAWYEGWEVMVNGEPRADPPGQLCPARRLATPRSAYRRIRLPSAPIPDRWIDQPGNAAYPDDHRRHRTMARTPLSLHMRTRSDTFLLLETAATTCCRSCTPSLTSEPVISVCMVNMINLVS
jgi:hypothetical protein